MAHILKRLGWQDITCVDQYETPTPVVRGVKWTYLNLSNLADAITLGDKLPAVVENMQGNFDIVTMSLAFLGSEGKEEEICRFFAKPEGYIFHI